MKCLLHQSKAREQLYIWRAWCSAGLRGVEIWPSAGCFPPKNDYQPTLGQPGSLQIFESKETSFKVYIWYSLMWLDVGCRLEFGKSGGEEGFVTHWNRAERSHVQLWVNVEATPEFWLMDVKYITSHHSLFISKYLIRLRCDLCGIWIQSISHEWEKVRYTSILCVVEHQHSTCSITTRSAFTHSPSQINQSFPKILPVVMSLTFLFCDEARCTCTMMRVAA